MELKDIEALALKTLKDVSYQDSSDSIDIINVANLLGFQVANAAMDDNVDGFILVDENRDELLGLPTNKLIGVNSSRTLQWKRFIIAHEIGHYAIHCHEKGNIGLFAHREHAKGKSRTENEVDYFAANILMPRDKFTNKYTELRNKGLSVQEAAVLLADKFVVTNIMAERRIEELELS